MQIRKLTAEDAALFRGIRIEMCARHPEAFGQSPDEVAATPPEKVVEWWSPREEFPERFILAAFEDKRLLGTAALRRDEAAKERHRAWIWGVYVRPEARGRAVGKQLMQKLIEEARKIDGLEVLTLEVALPQTSARTLYTSLGFFTTGLVLHSFKLPDGRYTDHEVMMLWL